MTRRTPSPNVAVVVLLVCIFLAVVAGTGVIVAVIVYTNSQEVEYKRDRERINQIDREIAVERLTRREEDGEYHKRVDTLIREQNTLVGKWHSRLPGRTEQLTHEEFEKKYGR